mgnify:CR=1 FL=1
MLVIGSMVSRQDGVVVVYGNKSQFRFLLSDLSSDSQIGGKVTLPDFINCSGKRYFFSDESLINVVWCVEIGA